MRRIKEVLSSKIFLKHFLFLLGIICIVFLSFTFYMYYNSTKALQNEFLSYSMIETERIATVVDEHIMDMRMVVAALYTNSTVNVFLNHEDPSYIIDNIYTRLQEQLRVYINSTPSIDSIYLYSSKTNLVLDAYSVNTLYDFPDSGWMDHLPSDDEAYLLIPREKYGRYPYLLSIIKTMGTASGKSAVIINIDLSMFSPLSSLIDTQKQEIFLVNDDNKILYRKDQKDSLEPLNTVPELSVFTPAHETNQSFLGENSPYIFTQYHSAEYPWSYVSVTNMNEYYSRLTDYRFFLFVFLFLLFIVVTIIIFFFASYTTGPLHAIVRLLDSHDTNASPDVNTSQNNEIVKKIMAHMQTNKYLAEELTNQMELLNKTKFLALQSQINPHFLFNTLNMIHVLEIDTLGYEHAAPKMTLLLSQLLQYALESADLVSLETEFHYADLLMIILNQRYKNKFDFQISMQSDCAGIKIPKLTIQPLIENAAFHGVSDVSVIEGHIRIEAIRNDGRCVITVRDNGVGIPVEKLEHIRKTLTNYKDNPKESIGLHNVALRMHLLFGDDFHISIDSVVNHGTVIQLDFPEME